MQWTFDASLCFWICVCFVVVMDDDVGSCCVARHCMHLLRGRSGSIEIDGLWRGRAWRGGGGGRA